MRCVYVDLDGTLLGRGARCCATARASSPRSAVRALEACLRADVEFVIYLRPPRGAGARGRAAARLQRVHLRGWERGLVIDDEREWLTGELVPGERSIHDQIEDAGAPALLLERYAGRLEYHEPWHLDREVSHLFRGLVDAFEVDALLGEAGHGHLRLVDNGVVPRALADARRELRRARLPPRPGRGVEGGRGRAPHAGRAATRARSASRSATRARTSDAADVVGTFWLVANALRARPDAARGDRRPRQRARGRGRPRGGRLRGGRHDARREKRAVHPLAAPAGPEAPAPRPPTHRRRAAGPSCARARPSRRAAARRRSGGAARR